MLNFFLNNAQLFSQLRQTVKDLFTDAEPVVLDYQRDTEITHFEFELASDMINMPKMMKGDVPRIFNFGLEGSLKSILKFHRNLLKEPAIC